MALPPFILSSAEPSLEAFEIARLPSGDREVRRQGPRTIDRRRHFSSPHPLSHVLPLLFFANCGESTLDLVRREGHLRERSRAQPCQRLLPPLSNSFLPSIIVLWCCLFWRPIQVVCSVHRWPEREQEALINRRSWLVMKVIVQKTACYMLLIN